MKQQVLCILLAVALTALPAAHGQVNPKKGQPIFIKTGQVYKMTWKPAPPHPDVVMCCGGALQLSWSPMDSGVVSSVVLNNDDSCPNSLQNQQFVKYIFQAQPKGLVTLDFKQNGDYYISCAVAEHCSAQGMQFLLAVRGCTQDNSVYTPVVPLNVQCGAQALGNGLNNVPGGGGGAGFGGAGAAAGFGAAAKGANSGFGGAAGFGNAGLPGDAPQDGRRRRNGAGAAAGVAGWAAALAAAGAAVLAL